MGMVAKHLVAFGRSDIELSAICTFLQACMGMNTSACTYHPSVKAIFMFIETSTKESMDIVSAKCVELYDSWKKHLVVEKYSEVVPHGRVLPTNSTLLFEIAIITLPPEVEAVKDMCKATAA
jgi:hypothetical protein